ncbi:MAG TPA: radical SAM protein, partial [Blastocatellia bacterium]|nr:radical SAM protein [Blastocatellia bacterium]
PLEKYSLEDVRREFYTEKPCASFCTIACVQQVAMLDNWRAPQTPFNRPSKTDQAKGIAQEPVGA